MHETEQLRAYFRDRSMDDADGGSYAIAWAVLELSDKIEHLANNTDRLVEALANNHAER